MTLRHDRPPLAVLAGRQPLLALGDRLAAHSAPRSSAEATATAPFVAWAMAGDATRRWLVTEATSGTALARSIARRTRPSDGSSPIKSTTPSRASTIGQAGPTSGST